MIVVVPPDAPFLSYAQNREDVVLWRALGDLAVGRYVEVGANHPQDDSVTKAFYDRGWAGITIEPVHEFAQAHRDERPRDTMIEAVITDEDVDSVVLHEIAGTGLSTIVDSVGSGTPRPAPRSSTRRSPRCDCRTSSSRTGAWTKRSTSCSWTLRGRSSRSSPASTSGSSGRGCW